MIRRIDLLPIAGIAIACITYFAIPCLQALTIVSLLTIAIAIYYNLKLDHYSLLYSSVIIFYTILTQFGLIIPYSILGRSVVSDYSTWTLRFLDSPYLIYAVFLGNFAVLVYCVGKGVALRRQSTKKIVQVSENQSEVGLTLQNSYLAGILMLGFVILYFAYHIVFGGTAVFSTYEIFMSSSAYNNSLYSSILVAFSVGTVYIAAAGSISKHKVGWGIWGLIVVFFALNGNKGEFLYPLLAVFGMYGVSGKKLSLKMIGLIGVVMFIVIPAITALRGIGVAGNFTLSVASFFDAFVEMGMQIRTSVYALEDLNNGTIHYLYGASYYKPFLNMIPFVELPVATQELRELYPGYGFTQVIESYCNFGIIGIIMFFGCMGYFVTKAENRLKNRMQLAYLGSVISVLINACRNYFAFVPGQLIIVSVVYFIVKGLKLKRSKNSN